MERADKRKYHYIYKTTCKVSGRWYIGMHSTSNLEDGYIGSGKRLWHSINKHGRENHVCEILEFLPDRQSLASRERELVSAETLKEELCMNLKVGGEGGGGFFSKEQQLKASAAGNVSKTKKLKEDPVYAKRYSEITSAHLLRDYASGARTSHWPKDNWVGKKHSEESKAKMSATRRERCVGIGDKNSQFDIKRIGIHKDGIIKHVLHSEIEEYLELGWKKGHKEKQLKQTKEEKRQPIIDKILNSDIDVTKAKWALKLSDEIGMSRNSVKNFIKEHLPSLWSKCFIEISKRRE